MALPMDITGQKYGRLIAIKRNGFSQSPSRKHILWECLCDCGETITTKLNALRNGDVNSCGCLRKEGNRTSHKMIHTPEYASWSHMKDRCKNINSKDFKNYGGRGISVCERWDMSFENFFSDVGARPTSAHSIDRINVDGNYEPSNCRWATNFQQARNKRVNVFLEVNGKKQVLSDWAREIGINVSTLYARLSRHSIEIALTLKKGVRHGTK